MRTAEENRRAEVAHHTAYTVMPRHTSDRDRLIGEFAEEPDLTAVRWYLEAAKILGRIAVREDVAQLRGHTGRLDADRDYYLIEYPRFPAVDLVASLDTDGNTNAALSAVAGRHVLAPYFSAALIDRETREVRCFVLGQSDDPPGGDPGPERQPGTRVRAGTEDVPQLIAGPDGHTVRPAGRPGYAGRLCGLLG
jgi:hypothetical protein